VRNAFRALLSVVLMLVSFPDSREMGPRGRISQPAISDTFEPEALSPNPTQFHRHSPPPGSPDLTVAQDAGLLRRTVGKWIGMVGFLVSLPIPATAFPQSASRRTRPTAPSRVPSDDEVKDAGIQAVQDAIKVLSEGPEAGDPQIQELIKLLSRYNRRDLFEVTEGPTPISARAQPPSEAIQLHRTRFLSQPESMRPSIMAHEVAHSQGLQDLWGVYLMAWNRISRLTDRKKIASEEALRRQLKQVMAMVVRADFLAHSAGLRVLVAQARLATAPNGKSYSDFGRYLDDLAVQVAPLDAESAEMCRAWRAMISSGDMKNPAAIHLNEQKFTLSLFQPIWQAFFGPDAMKEFIVHIARSEGFTGGAGSPKPE